MIAPGDFTELAQAYDCRAGYSHSVLRSCLEPVWDKRDQLIVADVGAGTGKLTQDLDVLGLSGFAIEPNEAMFKRGSRLRLNFQWLRAFAEKIPFRENSVDIVTMGSAFHWTDRQKALMEFHRILKPGGLFVALWNPRDLVACSFQRDIDEWIQQQIPNFTRVSSGSPAYTQSLSGVLVKEGYFSDVVFVEDRHEVAMSRERYLGVWRSVNDIRSQAGEIKFQKMMAYIEKRTEGMQEIIVPYITRAWVAKSTK